MMNYKIWNKVDAINGISASLVLEKNPYFREKEIFLILKGDLVEEICIKDIKCEKCNLDISTPVDQVAQAYLNFKIQESEQIVQDQLTLEQQATKIATLETGLANMEYILMMGGLV